jgi:hypothetical protein
MTTPNFRALCAEMLDCDDGAIFGMDLVTRARAATLLQQPPAPAPAVVPVPVSERLPGAKDLDVCGRCWMFDPCDRG